MPPLDGWTIDITTDQVFLVISALFAVLAVPLVLGIGAGVVEQMWDALHDLFSPFKDRDDDESEPDDA